MCTSFGVGNNDGMCAAARDVSKPSSVWVQQWKVNGSRLMEVVQYSACKHNHVP